MTIDDLRRTRLTRSALSEHDEQLVGLLCELYQSLGDTYHRSEPYQQMVAQYPTLAMAIEECSNDWWLPDSQAACRHMPLGSRATPLLWERSHGDR